MAELSVVSAVAPTLPPSILDCDVSVGDNQVVTFVLQTDFPTIHVDMQRHEVEVVSVANLDSEHLLPGEGETLLDPITQAHRSRNPYTKRTFETSSMVA